MLFVVILILFLITSIGPGWLIVRRLRLSQTEKMVTAVGASYVFVFLAAFAIYLLDLSRAAYVGITVISTLACWLSVRDLVALFHRKTVRHAAVGWLIFAGWGLLLLACVRHYAGGTWSADWLEHYQRALFFLNHRPLDVSIIGLYSVPARPPAMNLIATAFLAQVGDRFENYQVLFTLLNSLVALPAFLIAGTFFKTRPSRIAWLLLALLVLNPMVAQNLTYAWTRLFTAFYIVLGVHLYLRGWKTASRTRLVLAFASLAMAGLCHFSAGPFAIFIGLHYVLAVWWQRKGKFVEIALITLVVALIVTPYFGWAIRNYGAKGALASNTSVSGQQGTAAAGRPADVATNVFKTLLPTVLWRPGIMTIEELSQPSTYGSLRDYTFLVYQVGFPWALGSAGMVLIGLLMIRISRVGPFLKSERLFWLLFVPFTFVLGIAVNPGVDRFGVAHICLQPLVVMGLAFLAAGLPLIRARWKWLILPGLLLDFGLGVFLHFSLQGLDYYIVELVPGKYTLKADQVMSQASQANAGYKLFPTRLIKDQDPTIRNPTVTEVGLTYFGDRFAGLLPVLQLVVLATAGGIGLAGIRSAFRSSGKPPVAGLASRTGGLSVQPTRRRRGRK